MQYNHETTKSIKEQKQQLAYEQAQWNEDSKLSGEDHERIIALCEAVTVEAKWVALEAIHYDKERHKI